MRLSLIAVAILLTACTPGTLGGTEGRPSPEDTSAAEAQAAAEECEASMGDFLTELQEINSRLSVGLSYDEYGTLLGDARVVYDQIDFDAVSQDCTLEVGIPLEDAYNKYIEAFNIWDRCISDFDCSINEIQPEMRQEWSDATDLIQDAETGLEDLATP